MRRRISTPGTHLTVDVCTGTQLDKQVHYVLVCTTYRATNKALQVQAEDLDQLLADLVKARTELHAKGVATAAQPAWRAPGTKHCPVHYCRATPGAPCRDILGNVLGYSHPERGHSQ